MIKIIVARADNDKFEEYLEPSLKQFPNIQLIQIHNNEHLNSMARKYNAGIQMIQSDLKDSDVVGFMHSDVKILDSLFEKKIEMVFEKRKNVGMLGLIGTISFPEAGGWWIGDYSLHRGSLMQGKPGTDGKETYFMNRKRGYFEDLVSIDGFSFFLRGKVAKEVPFDEITYSESWHFYDVDQSFSVLEAGWELSIFDSLLEHSSEGPLPNSWFINKEKFIKKWKDKGFTFPITKEQFRKNVIKKL